MLRTNLSTRPFYNERGLHAIGAVVGILVLAVAAWQAVAIVRLSTYKTELNASIKRYKAETDVRERDAAEIRRGMDQKELLAVAAAAKEANQLIEQRTFSWTQLFNELEATLPDDVMLLAVRPDFKDGATEVTFDVQGRNSDDIDAFWNRLEKTGEFHNVQWSAVSMSDDGLNKMAMKAIYTPARPAGPQPAAVKPPAPPQPTPPAAVKPPTTAPATQPRDASSGRKGRGK